MPDLGIGTDNSHIPVQRDEPVYDCLVRRHLRFFTLFTTAAFALRLLFFWKLRFIAGDSLLYGDIAKNWIEHGMYAMNDAGVLVPTDIRLPGYPGFLALVWLVAGVEHYTAVMIVQIFADVGTCFVAAAIARRLVSERAGLWAFALAALCPFTANYAVTPLAETLSVFFTALSLLCSIEALDHAGGLKWWAGCGLAIAASILLRPDGGLLLAAVVVYLAVRLIWKPPRGRTLAGMVIVSAVSLALLVPWTIRNWRVFHQFQPLAPRYATNPGEYAPLGYIRWTTTWIVDYSSVEDVYWHVPGEFVNVDMLPSRAFDNAEQRRETERLFDEYNRTLAPLSPELDSKFARLADQRIADSRFRYYVWLPILRVADTWLRPRTEALALDPHWWDVRKDPRDAAISIFLGSINLVLIAAALVGLLRRRVRHAAFFILWVLLRCGLLATVESPETRYTLECFPVVFVFAAGVLTTEETADTEVGGGNRTS